MMIWSRNPLTYPQLLPSTPIDLFGSGATVTAKEIAIVLSSFIVMGLLLLIVHKTRLGRAMRATAEQPNIAALMGVNPNRVISITFMLGGSLAALAGVMMATNYGNAHFAMGFIPGLKGFTAAVLGGIGNIQGAMLGGLLLGLIEALGAGYIGDWTGGVLGSNYQDIFAFMVLILVLVLRPRGLLGEKVSDRA
jgi:branched-chain amino acid transport system permease protein